MGRTAVEVDGMGQVWVAPCMFQLWLRLHRTVVELEPEASRKRALGASLLGR